MRMFKHSLSSIMVAVMMTAAITGCSKDEPKQDYNPLIDDPKPEQPVNPSEPTASIGRDEQYRPQIHFTPAKNWINDPNGMVYVDGVYHLFYQYNPQSNDWGNMSWGHATSTDLIHWTEQSVALTRDELGDIFSGSAVIDKNNTAGFGTNAMVAVYTSPAMCNSKVLPIAQTAARTSLAIQAILLSRITTITYVIRKCSGMKPANNGSWL